MRYSSSTAKWEPSTTTSRSAPRTKARLRHLGASGRIAFGPWYILMDEFLVSGETIVRNLSSVSRRAAAFGGAMEIGYLPDMFGHIAQMPQILRQPASKMPSSGEVSRRSDRQDRLFLGVPRWLGRTGRVPPRSGYSTEHRSGRTPRHSSGSLEAFEGGALPFLIGPTAHSFPERDRPPSAPAVAGPGRGRSE